MGRIMQLMKLRNSVDVVRAAEGQLAPDAVRHAEIEALVDTGATTLVLPADVVATLGLHVQGTRPVKYADGRVTDCPWVGNVEIEILGRKTITTALVHEAGTTPLIGQIPLEELDLLVDPKSRELRVNPASPDAPLMEIMSAA